MGEAFAYKEYLAGLLAGVATVITGFPFDTVKLCGRGGQLARAAHAVAKLIAKEEKSATLKLPSGAVN